LIFDTMLSSIRRRAAFEINTRRGSTIHVSVKEAAKVSEMCGCARQRCTGSTGKVEICKEKGNGCEGGKRRSSSRLTHVVDVVERETEWRANGGSEKVTGAQTLRFPLCRVFESSRHGLPVTRARCDSDHIAGLCEDRSIWRYCDNSDSC
jgi:hypothetical protein